MVVEHRILLEAAARVVLDTCAAVPCANPTGDAAQPDLLRRRSEPLPPFAPERPFGSEDESPVPPVARPTDLAFDNGVGGFSADGREYVIYLGSGQQTPAPWINVVANPEFGFLVSEPGAGHLGAQQRREPAHALEQRSGDGPAGEVLYLRDEETASSGRLHRPCGEPVFLTWCGTVQATVFEHNSHGLRTGCACSCRRRPGQGGPLASRKRLARRRRITATYYAEWVLGVSRCRSVRRA